MLPDEELFLYLLRKNTDDKARRNTTAKITSFVPDRSLIVDDGITNNVTRVNYEPTGITDNLTYVNYEPIANESIDYASEPRVMGLAEQLRGRTRISLGFHNDPSSSNDSNDNYTSFTYNETLSPFVKYKRSTSEGSATIASRLGSLSISRQTESKYQPTDKGFLPGRSPFDSERYSETIRSPWSRRQETSVTQSGESRSSRLEVKPRRRMLHNGVTDLLRETDSSVTVTTDRAEENVGRGLSERARDWFAMERSTTARNSRNESGGRDSSAFYRRPRTQSSERAQKRAELSLYTDENQVVSELPLRNIYNPKTSVSFDGERQPVKSSLARDYGTPIRTDRGDFSILNDNITNYVNDNYSTNNNDTSAAIHDDDILSSRDTVNGVTRARSLLTSRYSKPEVNLETLGSSEMQHGYNGNELNNSYAGDITDEQDKNTLSFSSMPNDYNSNKPSTNTLANDNISASDKSTSDNNEGIKYSYETSKISTDKCANVKSNNSTVDNTVDDANYTANVFPSDVAPDASNSNCNEGDNGKETLQNIKTQEITQREKTAHANQSDHKKDSSKKEMEQQRIRLARSNKLHPADMLNDATSSPSVTLQSPKNNSRTLPSSSTLNQNRSKSPRPKSGEKNGSNIRELENKSPSIEAVSKPTFSPTNAIASSSSRVKSSSPFSASKSSLSSTKSNSSSTKSSRTSSRATSPSPSETAASIQEIDKAVAGKLSTNNRKELATKKSTVPEKPSSTSRRSPGTLSPTPRSSAPSPRPTASVLASSRSTTPVLASSRPTTSAPSSRPSASTRNVTASPKLANSMNNTISTNRTVSSAVASSTSSLNVPATRATSTGPVKSTKSTTDNTTHQTKVVK